MTGRSSSPAVPKPTSALNRKRGDVIAQKLRDASPRAEAPDGCTWRAAPWR
jgi:hypothetical protein